MTTQNLMYVDTALWYKRLAETNNKTFMPLFFDRHRFLVLKGGAGGGKSIFAGRKILERATSEPGHRFLVCRKVGRTVRESCFKQIVSQANEFYPDSGVVVNKSEMKVRFDNGSEIIFVGLDDTEKLKSIFEITGIWVEETSELTESDLNQLSVRLRPSLDYYEQIILTFNPVSAMHWLKKRFFDKSGGNAKTHHSTYKDNRFLKQSYIDELEGFKTVDEYYYSVYCLGQWGVIGNTVFNARVVTERLSVLDEPVAVGSFVYDYDGLEISNIRFVESEDGFINIYSQPQEGRPYVIGGDTAGEGSDQFVGQVVDNISSRQVCTLRHTFDEDVYARQMYCLGKYYGDGLIAIETNYSTYPVKELERLGYKNMFVREREDTFTHKIVSSYGFRTDSKTRPIIIAQLVQIAREDIGLFYDHGTLTEMLTFVRNEQMRAEAQQGAHDDCIMALAIAYYARGQMRTYALKAAGNAVKWEKDQYEDYARASQKDRQSLLKMWGVPKDLQK